MRRIPAWEAWALLLAGLLLIVVSSSGCGPDRRCEFGYCVDTLITLDAVEIRPSPYPTVTVTPTCEGHELGPGHGQGKERAP
jgi:hypothetical protein